LQEVQGEEMKIRAVELEKSQLGWQSNFWICVSTDQQFTDVEMYVVGVGKYLLTALWNGWRNSKRVEKIHRATRQQREKKGWAS
jgi:hypothetical protein